MWAIKSFLLTLAAADVRFSVCVETSTSPLKLFLFSNRIFRTRLVSKFQPYVFTNEWICQKHMIAYSRFQFVSCVEFRMKFHSSTVCRLNCREFYYHDDICCRVHRNSICTDIQKLSENRWLLATNINNAWHLTGVEVSMYECKKREKKWAIKRIKMFD